MPILNDIRTGRVRDAAIDRHELINLSRDAIVGHWDFRGWVQNLLRAHGLPEQAGIKFKQNGGITFESSKIGSIIEHDISSLIGSKIHRDFTIEVWVKPTNQVYQPDWRSTNIITMTDPSRNDGQNIAIKWNNQGNMFEFALHTGFHTITNAAVVSCSVNPGQLHHVVATFSGSNLRLYVDYAGAGSSFHEQAGNFTAPVDSRSCGLLSIGNTSKKYRFASGESEHRKRTFYGDIDTLRIYNRALAPEEIARLYHTYKDNVWRDDVEFPLYASIEDISVKLLNPFFDALAASPGWSHADGSGAVKSLNLNGIPLSARAGEFIALIKGNTSLESLDIRNTDFPVESVKSLLEAIINHPNLSIVAMPEGILSSDEYKMLGDILAKRRARIKGAGIGVMSLVNAGRAVANLSVVQNEHFTRWDKALRAYGSFTDETMTRLRQELFVTFRGQSDINNVATQMQFDAVFIQRVTSHGISGIAAPQLEQFKALAEETIADKASAVQKSIRELQRAPRLIEDVVRKASGANLDSKITRSLLEFQTSIGVLGHNPGSVTVLDGLKRTSSDLSSILTTLDNVGGAAGPAVRDIVGMVNKFDDIQAFAQNAIGATQSLFESVARISEIPNKSLESLVELRVGLTGTFTALGPVLNIAGVSPEVVGKIVAAGSAVSTIATSFSQIAGGFAVLGPAGAIVGGFGAVFSVFGGKGPSKEERMISQLGQQMNAQFDNLNRNLSRLAEHMDMQFSAARQDIYEMRTDIKMAIYQSTTALAEVMESHFEVLNISMGRQFAVLSADIKRNHDQILQHFDALHLAIGAIDTRICVVQNTITRYAAADQTLNYTGLKDNVFGLTADGGLGEAGFFAPGLVLELGIANQHAQDLAQWAKLRSTHPAITGIALPDATSLIDAVSQGQHGINYRINSIRLHMIAHGTPGLDANAALANPEVWGDAAITYMRFVFKYMQEADPRDLQNFCKGQTGNIDAIAHKGQEIINFINYIKRNPITLLNLCENYIEEVKKLCSQSSSVVVAPTGADTAAPRPEPLPPKYQDINELYNLITIISALTFNSIRVQSFIEERLFDGEQFNHFLQKSGFHAEVIRNNLSRAIIEFQELLKTAEPEYGFIKDILHDLEAVKGIYASIANATPEILGLGSRQVPAIGAGAGAAAQPPVRSGTPISWLFKPAASQLDAYKGAKTRLLDFLGHNRRNILINNDDGLIRFTGTYRRLNELKELLNNIGLTSVINIVRDVDVVGTEANATMSLDFREIDEGILNDVEMQILLQRLRP